MWSDLFQRCDKFCVFFYEIFHAAHIDPFSLHGEEEGHAARTDSKLVLDHPLTAADLGEGKKQTPGSRELLRCV